MKRAHGCVPQSCDGPTTQYHMSTQVAADTMRHDAGCDWFLEPNLLTERQSSGEGSIGPGEQMSDKEESLGCTKQ